MSPAPVLAIDLGSSSLRVARFGADAMPLALAQRPYAFRSEPHRGIPPTEVAVLLAEAIAEVLAATASDPVERVVVSALWHSVLGVDAADRPMTEVMSWESMEPDEALDELAAVLDVEGYRARTGSYLHASYPLAGIVLLRSRGAAPARWTDLPSWALRRVLGVEVGWSSHLAAGSGMFHQSEAVWDEATLSAVGLDAGLLGEVWREPVRIPARAPSGLAGAELLPVLGDGFCDSLGIGATGPGTSALTAATSGSLRLIVDGVHDSAPSGLWRYRVGEHRTGFGGAISNAGNLMAWVRGELGVDDPLAFAAADAPPVARGLVALPELAGERGPGYRRGVSGALVGLRGFHTREDVARELVLGACAVYGVMTDLMASASPELSRLITAGGIVRASPVFGQLLADATGRTVTVSGVAESSLRGAAVHAWGEATPPAPTVRDFEPRRAWVAALRERRAAMAEVGARLR